MNKKLSIAVATGAAVVLGGIGFAYASPNQPDTATSRRVLNLTSQTTQQVEIGAPTPDSVLGFRVVGADDLYNRSRLVGRAGRSCEAVADLGDQGVSFQCVFTATLDDGLITAQALPTFTPDGLQDYEAAITGGTGAYRHARGSVAVDQVTDTEARITIDLR